MDCLNRIEILNCDSILAEHCKPISKRSGTKLGASLRAFRWVAESCLTGDVDMLRNVSVHFRWCFVQKFCVQNNHVNATEYGIPTSRF